MPCTVLACPEHVSTIRSRSGWLRACNGDCVTARSNSIGTCNRRMIGSSRARVLGAAKGLERSGVISGLGRAGLMRKTMGSPLKLRRYSALKCDCPK